MKRRTVQVVFLGMCMAVGALGVTACKREKAASKKVTVDSTNDATQPMIDEDYRFKLDWPGTGWKLMTEQEIRKLSPDAVAGAIHPTDRIYGAIIVESAGNSELSQLARAIADNRPVEGAEFTDFEEIQLAGKPAIRFGMEGRAEGSPSTWRPSSSCIRATHI